MAVTRYKFTDASDFSPGIVTDTSGGGTALRELLRIIRDGAKDRSKILGAIEARFFPAGGNRGRNHLIALNPNNYGLIEDDLTLSPIGEQIADAPTEAEAVEELVRHAVRELCGPDLLRALSSVLKRGENPTKEALADELGLIGYNVTRTHTDHMSMLRWFREAGIVVGDRYETEIDELRLEALTGVRLDDLDEWVDLDEPQRAFLRALRQIAEVKQTAPVDVEDVRDLVVDRHGPGIWRRADQIPADVIYPLANDGWLVRPTHAGRGARMGQTAAKQRLLDVDISVLDRQLTSGLPPEVLKQLRISTGDLQTRLASSNRNVAGLALEVLAARIAVELGLTNLRLRERARQSTGNAEVDLLAVSVGRTVHHWIFQCKNQTGTVGVNVLAKEVGVADVTGSDVIVLLTTSRFSRDLYDFAGEVNLKSSKQVYLLKGTEVEKYFEQGIRVITRSMAKQARQIAELKDLKPR